jgi:peptide/nickel transport system substrate-binding protein
MSSAVLIASLLLGSAAPAQTLRVGLSGDPDLLDPDTSRTLVGRHVFEAICDKLLDYDQDLNFVPRLATSWQWSDDGLSLTLALRDDVVFHDGTPFNASAVQANFDRSLNMPGSGRRTDLGALESVDVVDEFTARLNLAEPFSPMLAQMSDRAGIMISPTAAEASGDAFGTSPVCSGPFRFVERVAQDRIVVERFDDYWDSDSIHLDGITFLIQPDSTVRLSNLRSGDVDLIERAAPTDLPVIEGDPGVEFSSATELGYQGITINIDNSPSSENDLARSALVRRALDLSIDRAAINQVAFDGVYTPGHIFLPPNSPFFPPGAELPQRDVEAARALLAEAGIPNPRFTLMVPNDTERRALAEILQVMAAEAGFDVQLEVVEFATSLQKSMTGDYDAYLLGWSGRIDPDGNIYQFAACDGPQNDSGYCNPTADDALNAARSTIDLEQRVQYYQDAFDVFNESLPRIYLYHRTWIFAHAAELSGFVANPDGLMRYRNIAIAR